MEGPRELSEEPGDNLESFLKAFPKKLSMCSADYRRVWVLGLLDSTLGLSCCAQFWVPEVKMNPLTEGITRGPASEGAEVTAAV
jgi:hypothetical protein